MTVRELSFPDRHGPSLNYHGDSRSGLQSVLKSQTSSVKMTRDFGRGRIRVCISFLGRERCIGLL